MVNYNFPPSPPKFLDGALYEATNERLPRRADRRPSSTLRLSSNAAFPPARLQRLVRRHYREKPRKTPSSSTASANSSKSMLAMERLFSML